MSQTIPNSSAIRALARQASKEMIKVKEKVAAAVGVATFVMALVAVHVNTQVELARIAARVDSFQQTNVQTLEVLNKLADSVDRLSINVARLEERTGSLERERE